MRRNAIRLLAAIAAVGAGLLSAASPALALDDCPTQPDARIAYSDATRFESVAFDGDGRLYFTDSANGELLMIPRSGAEPRVIAEGIDAPGGIVFRRDGDVLVGFGDSIAQGADGEENPEAGLLQVDPKTGRSSVWVDGLQMANGVTRGPGGQIFASTDFGTGIDRIVGGVVELAWVPMDSPNGLIVDSSKRYLFANQTFTADPTIQRIPLANPAAAEPWFTAPGEAGAFLDGLTRDADDNLYAAANGSGEVWKVSGPDEACVLMQLDPFPSGPSDLAFARGKGRFPKGSLFVTTFGGELLQLRHAR
jgi:sugar lactone lactonase YvrE